MSIMGVLFNPNGRIRANQFWQGLIILIAVGLVSSIVQFYGPPALSIVAMLVGIASIYMYVCVFGKRLHDSGKTAWISLLFLLGYFVIYTIGTMIVFPMIEGYSELQADMAAELENGFDLEVIAAYSERTAELVFLPNMILTPVVGLLTGFFCARLWSDPYPNKYGDPVGGYVADEDEDDFLT